MAPQVTPLLFIRLSILILVIVVVASALAINTIAGIDAIVVPATISGRTGPCGVVR